jgi:hypothetical protein
MLTNIGTNINPKSSILPFHGVEAVNNEIMGIRKLIRHITPER